ncbi:MAG: hypothetical protein L0226_05390 [Acidobacteria bacterium]|nr:hypothetical protein [Acidobacteriota bacterium]
MYTMPKYLALDEVTEISDELEGVMLETLRPCDTIHVRTRNSDYEVFLLDPEAGRALVKGGKYFAEPMEATVSGSTFGGGMLKMGWLGVGLRMEFCANGKRIATSPVRELRVEHESLSKKGMNLILVGQLKS